MKGSLNLIVISLVMLYLETKEHEYCEFLMAMPLQDLTKKELITDYNKELVKMFKEMVMKGDIKDSRSSTLSSLNKLKRARSLKHKRMRELRERQSHFLATHAPEEQPHSEEESESEGGREECIHCKLPHKSSSLNSLCYIRFSDLLPPNVMGRSSPFLLVTGCGHRIHKEC